MQNYDEKFNEAEALFDGFDGRVRDFAKKCQRIDQFHRFVRELNAQLENKIQTSAQAKAVVEVLRGQSWLSFIKQMRQNEEETAEAMLLAKNKLIEKYEIIVKSISNSAAPRDRHQSVSNVGSNEPPARKSY